jgi:hypothetical protein
MQVAYVHVSNLHANFQEGNDSQGFQLEAEAPLTSDPQHGSYVRNPLHESVRQCSVMSSDYIYAQT